MIKKIVVDVENTTTVLTDKYDDYSPYNKNNSLVSIGWMIMEDSKLGPVNYLFLSHKEMTEPVNLVLLEQFKKDLADSQFVIAHNAKYDLSWLAEAGFEIDHLRINDTMIMEYVMARGRNDISFKLADTCPRYEGIACKADDIFDKYPDMMIDAMPIAEVEDYGRADIQACAELYLAQCQRLARSDYRGMAPTVHMMHDFCKVLLHMQRNGVKIDIKALEQVGEQFSAEAIKLRTELNSMVRYYMGDTPVNLDSPAQLSEVVYSRRVKKDKEEEWVKTFNIGKNERNKNLKRPYFNGHEFTDHVKRMTDVVLKTKAEQCAECKGKGKIQKLKIDGSPWKKETKCKPCDGVGILYKELNEVGGLRMKADNVHWTTVNGISTSKTFLEQLAEEIDDSRKEKQFLEKIMRLSSVSSYLSNFVGGISAFTQKDTSILHPNFNQCITATGRLSSTAPNLQNQPRENTFPIRKVFISRFEGGKILEVDFKTLEFMAAVHLARDERGRHDILNGLDIHNQTAKILTEAGEPTERQPAKKHTFKPLYGGKTGTDAQKEYYRAFLEDLYTGIGAWHVTLQNEAIEKKVITIPTGRQFLFPDAKRTKWGGSTQSTQIVNYPVQSFATADILPIGLIRTYYEMKALNLKSLIVLTVHDSVVFDVHPDEEEIVQQIAGKLAVYATEELKKRYNIDLFLPLDVEVKKGYNLMETKKVA